uniref:Meiosis induction protein kinase IME2/SME1 n=1 Tax=Lygus hesperus TaxID=30085 RepID=A0A0A9VVJ0_LYGHE
MNFLLFPLFHIVNTIYHSTYHDIQGNTLFRLGTQVYILMLEFVISCISFLFSHHRAVASVLVRVHDTIHTNLPVRLLYLLLATAVSLVSLVLLSVLSIHLYSFIHHSRRLRRVRGALVQNHLVTQTPNYVLQILANQAAETLHLQMSLHTFLLHRHLSPVHPNTLALLTQHFLTTEFQVTVPVDSSVGVQGLLALNIAVLRALQSSTAVGTTSHHYDTLVLLPLPVCVAVLRKLWESCT